MPMADMKVLPAAAARVVWRHCLDFLSWLAGLPRSPGCGRAPSISICGRNVGISPGVGNTSAPVVCCLVLRFCTFYERC